MKEVFMRYTKALIMLLAFSFLFAMSCSNRAQETSQTVAVESNEVGKHIEQLENSLLPRIIVKDDPDFAKGYSLSERMPYYEVPGLSITVINNNAIEWTKGYGVAERGKPERIDGNTIFQTASISKTLTAMAALAMVQEGGLSLDRDMNEYLSSWKIPGSQYTKNKSVTLKHLLSHTGGVSVHGFDGYEYGEDVPSLIQVLDGIHPANSPAVRVTREPGLEFSYSGGGYCIIQQVMIDITGKTFPQVMKDYVLEPLNMTSSTFRQPLPDNRMNDAATGHDEGEILERKSCTYPEMAAAGLWCSSADLAKFAISLMKSLSGEAEEVLSQEMALTMADPVIGDYGLGIGVAGEEETFRLGHGGSNAGFQCRFQVFPESGKGIVVMTNSRDGGSRLIGEIIRGFYETYDIPIDPESRTAIEIPTEDKNFNTGIYKKSPGSRFEVKVFMEEEDLYVRIRDRKKMRLYAVDTHKYFTTDGYDFEFFPGEDGYATKVSVNGEQYIRNE